MTRHGGQHPLESSDGQFAYYLKPLEPDAKRPINNHIWKVPVDGGEETPVYEEGEIAILYWTLWNDHLIIHDGDYKTGIVIRSVDLTTGEESILADLGNERRYCFGLDVSSDGRWMFFSGRMGNPNRTSCSSRTFVDISPLVSDRPKSPKETDPTRLSPHRALSF